MKTAGKNFQHLLLCNLSFLFCVNIPLCLGAGEGRNLLNLSFPFLGKKILPINMD